MSPTTAWACQLSLVSVEPWQTNFEAPKKKGKGFLSYAV
jgi:hypothetical protein